MSQGQLNFLPSKAHRPVAALDPIPESIDRLVGIDVEHRGLGRDAAAVGLAVADSQREWYLPFGHAEGAQHSPETVRRWAIENLAGKDLIFRAAKNDIEVLRRWGVDLEALGARPHEVQHAAALLDDRRRKFDLDTLLKDRLGTGKVELPFPANTIWQQPADRVTTYARGDVRGTYDLHVDYAADIAREDLGKVLELEDSLIYCTLAMERAGCPLDIPKLERWGGEVKAAYTERILEIYRRTGLRVNPNTGNDLTKLFRHLGIQHSGYATDEGKESFVEEALLQHAGHWEGERRARHWVVDVPEVQLAVEARQLDSLLSKYILKYLRGHIGGVIYYQLHQLRADEGGTITGRYASSGIKVGGVPMGCNIQQVKKPDKQEFVTRPWIIREAFLPGRGRYFLDADASQIEYRLFAHYSNVPPPHSKRLIVAYNNDANLDFHQLVTDDILHGVMERVFAKNWNFRKLYGGGVAKSAAMTGLELDECEVMDADYDRLFPEAKRLLNFCTKLAENRGYVRTFLGRRGRFEPGDRFYAALNKILQGGAAELMKLKLLRLYNERKTLDLTLRATVHDEAIADIPTGDAGKRAVKLIEECFAIQEFPLNVPITWDVKIGKNWHEVDPPMDVWATRGDKALRRAEGRYKNP